jgi:hypothetical protein
MLFLYSFHADGGSFKEINHTLVGSAIFFGDVASNRSANEIPCCWIKNFEWLYRQHLFVFVLLYIKLDVLTHPDPSDFHLVKS